MTRPTGSHKSGVGSPVSGLEALVEKAFTKGVAAHGDLGLSLEDFTAQINSIITKHRRDPEQAKALKLITGPHSDDFYLASACAHNNSQAAWSRLAALYEKHIDNVSHSVCSTHQEARELASTMLGHLFCPDASRQCRIASYKACSSLATWLAAIVNHRAINQRQLKFTGYEPLDPREQAPIIMTETFETADLQRKYGRALGDSFEAAASQLSERERFALVSRFDKRMPSTEIARMLGVHPSQVIRITRQAETRFQKAVSEYLGGRQGLSNETIRECVTGLVGRSDLSIVSVLRRAEPPARAMQAPVAA